MKILIATSNEHKVQEFKEMAKGYDIEFLSLKDINFTKEIDESGNTYKENALIKVEAISNYTDLPVFADDSGIEIDDLGEHFPGVHTHRYAINNGGQETINSKLTKEHPGSKAKFTCVIAYKEKNKDVVFFKGEFKGTISSYVSSTPGFGYDPIFIAKGYNVPVSEIPLHEKDQISHRGKAFKQLLEYLKKRIRLIF